jgi:hypothetical protein
LLALIHRFRARPILGGPQPVKSYEGQANCRGRGGGRDFK